MRIFVCDLLSESHSGDPFGAHGGLGAITAVRTRGDYTPQAGPQWSPRYL